MLKVSILNLYICFCFKKIIRKKHCFFLLLVLLCVNIKTWKEAEEFSFYCKIFRLKTILWQLTTVLDGDGLLWFPALAAKGFNLLDNIHTFDYVTEHNVTVVKPGCLHGCNEELGTVCVWTSIGLYKIKGRNAMFISKYS